MYTSTQILNMKQILVYWIVFLTSITAFSQTENQQLTLEDIYQNGTYRQEGFGPVRWMKDSEGYSTLEPNATLEGVDIVRYEVKSGARSVLVDAQQLVPEGESQPLSVRDYVWSEDNDKLMIFTNTRKVWRLHTRGDYWVLDLPSGKLQQLGKSVPRATMMFAKFSPDASQVAYVSKLNIFVEDLGSGDIKQITDDGGDNIINGTFDWAYEEEFGARDGFRWSPDGTHIAYWQSDTEGIGTFYMINNIDSIYSQPIPLPYPKVGTDNSAVKVGVVSAEGGNTRWFDVPGDSKNNYLVRMDFIPDSDEVMIQQINRLQNTNKVWVGDINTMALNNILTDKDDAFLDVHDNIQWLDDNQYFTWTSEQDGWKHLYKVSRDGKEMDLITKGDFDVVRINRIDPKGGYVYYIASPDNYTQRYLYRSKINGKGDAERVTPDDTSGQHAYQISADAQWAIHTYQSSTTPRTISLVNLKNHKRIKSLQNNQALKDKVAALNLSYPEFIKVDIGEAELDAWMVKPPNFDPAKKYPIIFYVYGEPAGSTVQDKWGDLWNQYMAQQGYIVMSVDNRGTKVPRGRDWRKSIYRQIGILAAHDQAKAAQKIFEMFDFIDTERVGMWGWSGGGQMTMNCMFRYPEIYQTGIAVSFVSDQKLYDNIYQERYMGLLNDNQEGYKNGSPITHAYKLEGNLMIMHGTADDNVHYQSFEMLVNELIMHNKLFSMMAYPMRSHSISERENTSLHLRRTMERFWLENL